MKQYQLTERTLEIIFNMVDELEKESEVHSKITFESVEGEFYIAETGKYLITAMSLTNI